MCFSAQRPLLAKEVMDNTTPVMHKFKQMIEVRMTPTHHDLDCNPQQRCRLGRDEHQDTAVFMPNHLIHGFRNVGNLKWYLTSRPRNFKQARHQL